MRSPRLVLLAGLLAAGCTAGPTSAGAPVGDSGADVAVLATDLRFDPDRIEVAGGEPTTIHLSNDGGIVHDLVLDSGWESGRVDPGRSTIVTLQPLAESTVAWCSVPGHRSAGMELEVVVVADDA